MNALVLFLATSGAFTWLTLSAVYVWLQYVRFTRNSGPMKFTVEDIER